MALTMTPEIRAGIFAGESGGDYDALLGFNNRPGKQFADRRISQMTLGQLDEFDRSTYGPWSEGQLGYRATPTGAYQIVGDTRRLAAEALGFGPDTVYDRATQDRMGEWILQNQGTKAWAGYRGPGDPNAVTAANLNYGAGSGAGSGATAAPLSEEQRQQLAQQEMEKLHPTKPYEVVNGNDSPALYDFSAGRPSPIAPMPAATGPQDIGILANIIAPSRQARAQKVMENLRTFS